MVARWIAFTLAAATATGTVGVGACNDENSRRQQAAEIAFEVVVDEAMCGIERPRRKVIREEAAWAELWARASASDTAQRNEQSFDEKASGRWIRAFQAGTQRARQMPQTVVLICGDRESDLYELYDQKQAASAKLTVLQANILTSMLGGYWGRPSDGPPGPKILSEGIRVLQALVWYKQQCAIAGSSRGKRRHPT